MENIMAKEASIQTKDIQKIKKNQINLNSIFIISIILFVFILMLILNFNTGYTSDDYRYHYFYDTYMPNESTHPIKNIFEIPESMFNHYKVWGGRIVAHSLVQFFMMFDKGVFNVCNSLIFIYLGILIYYHIQPRFSKWKALYLGLIYMAMWSFIPEFGLSVMWVSGSCNYIWMISLILSFLIPFRTHEYRKNKYGHKLLKALIMIPFGILAGWTNENSGGATVLLACLYIGYWYIKKIKIPAWSITGIISACVGNIFLILAPGNKGRGEVIDLSFKALKQHLQLILKVSYDINIILIIALIVFTTMYIVQRKLSIKESAKKLIFPFMYLISGAASISVLVASPVVASRSWIFEVCFTLIAIGNILVRISFKHWLLGFERILLCICMLAICTRTFAGAYDNARKIHLQFSNEINQINQQKEEGITDVVITRLDQTNNKYSAFNGSSNLAGKDGWFNIWMAKYYGVNSISTEEN